MDSPTLHVVIRTPQSVVLDCDASSLRIPTQTGQVGLRPRSEASVLAVEPGLILLRQDDHLRFAATAGGLLHCDGTSASLMTPVAVIGDQIQNVLDELDRELAAPSAERETRTTLSRLEKNILQELNRSSEERIHSVGKES